MSATAAPGAAAASLPLAQSSDRTRLDAVDLLRGVVMVIMALDHARDYFTAARFDPTDLSQTTAALRAGLRPPRGHQRLPLAPAGEDPRRGGAIPRSPGLWLVLLEFTLVRWAWTFNPRVAGSPHSRRGPGTRG